MESSSVNIETSDYLNGTTWESNGGSTINFENDGDFIWYMDPSTTDDNYTVGTFEFYIGDDATEHIVKDLDKYGLTKEEIDGLIAENSAYSADKVACIDIHHESVIQNGVEMLTETNDAHYIGFLVNNDEDMDMTNVGRMNEYSFHRIN